MGKGGGGGSYVPNPTYGANKTSTATNASASAQASNMGLSKPPPPAAASSGSIFSTPVNQYNNSQLTEAFNNKQIMANPSNQQMLISRYRDIRMRGPDATPLQGPQMMLTQPKPIQAAQSAQHYRPMQAPSPVPGVGYTNGLSANAGSNFPAGFVPRPSPLKR